MREDYFLDDPEYVLDNGTTLEWASSRMNGTTILFFTPLALSTRRPRASCRMSPLRGNQSPVWRPIIQQYLRIDDSMMPGSSTGKALVRVSLELGFYDLEFWLFYPFNGRGERDLHNRK